MEELKYVMASLADITTRIDYDLPLMTDTETIDFYGRIRLAQFYQEGWELPMICEYPNPYELVAMLTNAIVVAHVVHYDITTVQEQTGKSKWVPKQYHCTQYLSRLHFYKKTDGFGLDECVRYALGHNPYEHNDQQASDWSVPVLSEDQKAYAAMDVVYLLEVWKQVSAELDSYSYKLDMLMLKYCLDFQRNGFPFDEDKAKEWYEKNEAELKSIALPINSRSYVQVRPYINSNMSDDLGLARLSQQGNERAKQVRADRKLRTQNSYISKWVEAAEDGCIFGKFKVGARSGRTTCDDENLQQLDRKLKGLFGLPEDGDEVMIFSDFAQIQMRGVCVVVGDLTMERLFREGKDVHSYVAEMTFGADFTKDHRTIAKTENFGLLFGAGIAVFGAILIKDADMWLSDTVLTGLKKKWLGLWKETAKWQTQGIKDWKKGVAWQTPLGRKYTAKMMTDQLAMQIQGFEAEVAKLALHYMWPKIEAVNARLPEGSPVVRLRNFVHDSYLFTGPNVRSVYEEVCVVIADAMQEAWSEMCQGVKITDLPMPVKVRVGFNWGDIDKKDVFIHEHKQ